MNQEHADKRTRILSLDQFRGYAILGMIFVNFISRFDATPWMLKHHRVGLSYNDTIAPIFVFAVGMGFRLSMLKTMRKEGLRAARSRAIKRYVLLTLVGFAVYAGYYWDALSDIGLAGLLALPFMDKGPRVRVAAAFVYAGLFQAVFSLTPYGNWLMASSFNGGPLGPLSWCFMLLLGTAAYDAAWRSDALARGDRWALVRSCVSWGVGLLLVGWALRAPWPGVKAEWPFSQFGMTLPYTFYATGLCFLTLLFFHQVCDVRRLEFPHLTILGENPLVLYLAHGVFIGLSHLVMSNQAPAAAIACGFLITYALCYGVAWTLHRKHIIVKI